MDNRLVVSEQFGLSNGLTLEGCERDIEIAGQLEELAYYVKGQRLGVIERNSLYRTAGYNSWETYCRERWNLSGTHARKLIQSAEVVENIKKLSFTKDTLPTTQRQTWPLIGLTPEQQAEAWDEAVRTAPEGGVSGISITQDKKISGRHVQETVHRLHTSEPQISYYSEIQAQFSDQSINDRDSYTSDVVNFELGQEQKPISKIAYKWSHSELERKEAVLNGETVIANQKTDRALIKWAQENELYTPIDRGTIWGNPFILSNDGTREEVIEKYKWYYELKPSLQSRIDILRGKVLGCWCYPESCHGNVLKEKANIRS
jgi:hypothetical protein